MNGPGGAKPCVLILLLLAGLIPRPAEAQDPVCSISTTSLNYGTVAVGSFVDRSFTISNTGGGSLTGNVSEPCSDFAIVSGAGSYSLSSGMSKTITVRFQPTTPGSRNCTIHVGSLCQEIAASGTGDIPPSCSISAQSLDFQEVAIGSTSDRSFTITNSGGGNLFGTVSESCPDFTIVSGVGSYNLGAFQQRTVVVRFAPTTSGVVTCPVFVGVSCGTVTCTGQGAAFTCRIDADVVSGPVPLEVQFQAVPSGGRAPFAYEWIFGDGTSGVGESISHSYTQVGTYSVTLTVTDADQKVSADVLQVTVTEPTSLTCWSEASVTSGSAPLAVQFNGYAAGGSPPYAFLWVFGDGTFSTEQNPVHVYERAGAYRVVTTLLDDSLKSCATIRNVAVTELLCSATANRSRGSAPLLVRFDAVPLNGVGPFSYSWDFDDGETSSLKDPVHVFPEPGNYVTTLTLTDSLGATCRDEVLVQVSEFRCLASVNQTTGAVPFRAVFSADAEGGVPGYRYFWDFGDGETLVTGFGENPEHLYDSTGVYRAFVQVTDGDIEPGSCRSADVLISVVGLESMSLVSEGSAVHGWSFPFRESRPGEAAEGIRVSDLMGPIDPTKWRIFRWSPSDSTYLEAGTDFTRLEPGAGYWIVTRSRQEFPLAGWTVPQVPFAVPIEPGRDGAPGWNQIGNPFTFPVAVAEFLVTDDVDTIPLTSSANTLTDRRILVRNGDRYECAERLPAGTSGWIRSLSPERVTLIVPPLRDTGTPVSCPDAAPEGVERLLSIRAVGDGVASQEVILGTGRVADERDLGFLSVSRPPLPPESPGVNLSVIGTRGLEKRGEFLVSVRAPSEELRWTLEITSSRHPVEFNLQFEGSLWPDDRTGFLLDPESGDSWPVRPGRNVRLGLRSIRRILELVVLSATPGDLPASAAESGLPPTPNPFTDRTGFLFRLAEPSPIRIEIFDVMGRLVQRLDRVDAAAGEHLLVWDGKDSGGNPASSGLYFASVRSGPVRTTYRLLKVR